MRNTKESFLAEAITIALDFIMLLDHPLDNPIYRSDAPAVIISFAISITKAICLRWFYCKTRKMFYPSLWLLPVDCGSAEDDDDSSLRSNLIFYVRSYRERESNRIRKYHERKWKAWTVDGN